MSMQRHVKMLVMQTSLKTKGRRTVVTGPIGSGKTTRVLQLVQTYRDAGCDVAGVVSLHLNADDPELESYRFRFLSSGEELSRWQRDQGYARAAGNDTDVIVIDECGPLELRGEGLWKELRRAWTAFPGEVVVTVRERLLDEFLNALDARGATDGGRARDEGRAAASGGAVEVIRLPDRSV